MKLFPLVVSSAFLLSAITVYGQNSIKLKATFNNSNLTPGQVYYSNKINDSVKVETLKFYISDITLYNNGELVYTPRQKYFLFNIENGNVETIMNDDPGRFDMIKFHLGIDSLTSVSGGFGDDLDPVNGMYWAWQSGYINFKLEGKTNVCPARDNIFQFHIGGYQYPYNTLQTITLDVHDKQDIIIEFDVGSFLSKIDLGEIFEVMSPNKKAMQLAGLIAGSFKIAE